MNFLMILKHAKSTFTYALSTIFVGKPEGNRQLGGPMRGGGGWEGNITTNIRELFCNDWVRLCQSAISQAGTAVQRNSNKKQSLLCSMLNGSTSVRQSP